MENPPNKKTEYIMGIPIELDSGGLLMKHALCNLQEIVAVDDCYILKATHCKDHNIFFLLEGGTTR